MTNAEITKTINDFGQRIDALETWVDEHGMACHSLPEIDADPFGKYAEPKPSQPELVEGFWYIISVDSIAQYSFGYFHIDGHSMGYSPEDCNVIRPATLDDLAVDMGGVKMWMVEDGRGIWELTDPKDKIDTIHCNHWYDRRIARAIAEAMHVPVITEAQWKELTK